MGYVYGKLKQAGDAREDDETFKEFKPEIAVGIYWERKKSGLFHNDLEMMWKIVSHIFLDEKSEPKVKQRLETEAQGGLGKAVHFILRQMVMAVAPKENAQEALISDAEAKIKEMYDHEEWTIAGFLAYFQRVIAPLASIPRNKWEARIMRLVAMQIGLATRVEHESREILELHRLMLSDPYKHLNVVADAGSTGAVPCTPGALINALTNIVQNRAAQAMALGMTVQRKGKLKSANAVMVLEQASGADEVEAAELEGAVAEATLEEEAAEVVLKEAVAKESRAPSAAIFQEVRRPMLTARSLRLRNHRKLAPQTQPHS